MKRFILMLMMVIGIGQTAAFAGNGDTYLNLSGGWMHRNSLNTMVSLEFESQYHNAWEVVIDVSNEYRKCPDHGVIDSESFWYKQCYTIGGAYKYNLIRWKNSTLKGRVSSVLGSESNKFMLGLGVGLEYNYALKNGMKLFALQKNDFRFWATDTFRNGVLVGIKIPLR